MKKRGMSSSFMFLILVLVLFIIFLTVVLRTLRNG